MKERGDGAAVDHKQKRGEGGRLLGAEFRKVSAWGFYQFFLSVDSNKKKKNPTKKLGKGNE